MYFSALSETQRYATPCDYMIAKAHKLTSDSTRWSRCTVDWQRWYTVEGRHQNDTEQ